MMEQPDRESKIKEHEPISMENIPLALGCLLDDVAQIKSTVTNLTQYLGIGAVGTRPVTLKEAAQFLSISERSLRKMVRECIVPHYQRNGTTYFFEKELLEWVKDSRVAPFYEPVLKRAMKYNKGR